MSGLVKGVKKVIKKVVSGVKKVFKKIASSKIGKAVLIAAAIYLGGAALGAWSVPQGVPFAANINGAWTSAGSQAAQSAAASSAHAGVAADAAAMGADAIAAGGGTGATTTAAATGGSGLIVGPPTPGAAMGPPTPTAAGVSTDATAHAAQAAHAAADPSLTAANATNTVANPRNIVESMMKSTQDIISAPFKEGGLFGSEGWIARNPVPALMGASAVAGAFTPDAIDVERERARLEEETRKERQKNFLISDTDVGRPSGTQLTRGGGLLFDRGGVS